MVEKIKMPKKITHERKVMWLEKIRHTQESTKYFPVEYMWPQKISIPRDIFNN